MKKMVIPIIFVLSLMTILIPGILLTGCFRYNEKAERSTNIPKTTG